MDRPIWAVSGRITVSAAFSTELPVWVYKRNGRLVPFEADKISQTLFAAGESLGRPDAFLARELADGVLHFVAREYAGTIPSTTQIADWVVKVVRELGHPDLARAYSQHEQRRRRAGEPEALRLARFPEATLRFNPHEPFAEFLGRCRREYGSQAVFSRDLLAAHADRLVTLTGLECPLELKGCILDPPAPAAEGGILESLGRARELAGDFVAMDGPEYALADDPDPSATARRYARELALGTRLTGLRALVHLNSASPPPWADELAAGPLFADQQRPSARGLRSARECLLEEWLGSSAGDGLGVYWHFGEADFSGANGPAGLNRLTRLALDNPRLTLAFDRPKRAFSLGEGLGRKHPAVLLTVGLHLPRLAELPGIGEANFPQKLGSLARLAVSAAVQKREFLRRFTRERPALAARFLLDRARLVVVPVGLEAVVRSFLGKGLAEGRPAVDLARRLLQSLLDDLRNAGRPYRLECCLDEGTGFADPTGDQASALAGLTGWDPAAAPRIQVRAAGQLHALTQGGTVLVAVPAEKNPGGEELTDVIRYAWQQTEVTGLRFVRPTTRPTQLTLLQA
jgi:hypothetical protein